MCSVKVTFILLISLLVTIQVQSKSVKRNQKDLTVNNNIPKIEILAKPIKSRSKSRPSAILAIEIVDPKHNATGKSKNSKRTISSQLGYGFQPDNYYSVSSKPKLVYYKYTHDIPAYQGESYYKNGNINVQKSIEYDLGSQQSNQQYYQPGTTLFTTLNQQGDVSQLSNEVPQQQVGSNVPVVYLKVYSNQLSNDALYPNLPDEHPYSNLNGVNLQTLLAQYLQHSYAGNDQNTHQEYANQPEEAQGQGQQDYYLNQDLGYHQSYQDQVSQYQYQQYQQPQDAQQYQTPQIYQQPQQNEQGYQNVDNADNLPTHENYPDDAHTRVIFHSNNGGHVPEKPQIPNVYPVPSVSSYKSNKNYKTEAQSYSNLEFKPSQQDYTIGQAQDNQGYYYYPPQQTQNSASFQSNYNGISQNLPQSGTENGDEKPYNYHAHPINNKRRNVRRLVNIKKETKVKKED